MKIKYYLDAPYVVRNLFLASLACLLLSFLIFSTIHAEYGYVISICIGIGGLSYLVSSLGMIITSYITKPRLIKKMVTNHLTSQDKIVLDAGIGSGLAGISIANLPWRPNVIGVDIWSKKDHQHNSIVSLKQNCNLAKVQDSVTIIQSDIRKIDLPDEQVDCVVCVLCIHNINQKSERFKAFQELTRLLKKQGSILLIDFQYIAEYKTHLEQCGYESITVSRFHFSTFPFLRVITAKKV